MRRPRPRLLPPLRLALVHLAAASAAAVAVVVVLLEAGPLGDVVLVHGYPLLAALHAAAGLLAWWRRPANRLGPLLLVAAAAWLTAGLQNTGHRPLIAVGLVCSTVPLSVVVHLLHACPSGRLRDRASQLTVAGAYVVGVVLQVPLWAFTPQPPPFDAALVSPRPEVALLGYRVQQVCGVAVVAATVWLFVRWLRQYDPAERRVLGPLLGLGLVAVVAIPVGGSVLRPLLGPERAFALELIPLAGVPLGLLAVVLRGGFARTGELSAFVTSVASSSGSRDELEEATARTLGDPSVALLHWTPNGYVDAAGRPVLLPPPGDRRAVVEAEVAGRRLGAVAYDQQLNPDPASVAAVVRVVAIALDRARLAREVSESRGALRDASSRLLRASDLERRRIAQDLHDGLQVSLVRLSMQAHQLAHEPPAAVPALAAQLAADVDRAAADLRALVHGVMPAPLVERGLAAAVQELAYGLPVRARLEVDGIPVRLPAAVESTAYFVVAEALTNVVKHAGADTVAVRLRLVDGALRLEVTDDGRGGAHAGPLGAGLSGLRDRLEVLGGSFTVTSGDTGTRLEAALPCA